MNQTEFNFNPPRARRTDPATSQTAAARVGEFEADHFSQILAALAHADMTVYQIAHLTGLEAHAIGKRMSELQALHKAEPTGEEKLGPKGRPCRVWRRL